MKRTLANDIISHLLDEKYQRHNLWHRDYTPDVVEHWLRFHWAWLEALRDDGDLDAVCVYSDLETAIKRLPDEPRKVVRMFIHGFPATQITEELGVNATKVAKVAYKQLSDFLTGA